MSETKYRIVPVGNLWRLEQVIGSRQRYIAKSLTRANAERIAHLLTEDDDRIAREGHAKREQMAYTGHDERLPMDPPSMLAWAAWWSAQQRGELDRLEAAYRATLEPQA